MNANDMNTDTAANDLTQLSSREQLSALMDSALPADQTRFLLRRLQHDAPLAECWDRWRIAGEVMRGLAPAQRLPADFAARVSAALHAGDAAAAPARSTRNPAWLRWGGGAAMAASLAVVALMTRQADPVEVPTPAKVAAVAQAPQPREPAPAPVQAPAIETAAATAVAAAAVRPQRDAQARATRPPSRLQPAAEVAAPAAQVAALQPVVRLPAVQAPQSDIVTRPWPRSVLPQYASGGLAVGFGEHVRGNPPYNPFPTPPQTGFDNPSPIKPADTPASEADGEARAVQAAPAAEPQREPAAQP